MELLALSKQSIVDQCAMEQGKKPAKTFMYEEDMSHLASDYSYTSGRTTAREKRFFVGILNEDKLLPNNNRPSREGTRWFSHSLEFSEGLALGWPRFEFQYTENEPLAIGFREYVHVDSTLIIVD